MALIRVNTEKHREATMARFLIRLNYDIRDIMELHHNVELEDLVHLAMKVKKQLWRKDNTRQGSYSWKSSIGRREDKALSRPTVKELRQKQLADDEGPTSSKPQQSRDIKCFRFLETGHVTSQCPNKKVMIMRENGEPESKAKEDSDFESMPTLEVASDVECPEGGDILFNRRVIST